MRKYFRRSIAITNEHGSWVFLLSPLLIGIFAGGHWSTPLIYLIIASLAGFLIRQPIAIAVKVYSGRRVLAEIYPRLDFGSSFMGLSAC